jgi:hypothetical protein
MCTGEMRNIRFWLEILKKENRLGDIGIVDRLILKCVLKK